MIRTLAFAPALALLLLLASCASPSLQREAIAPRLAKLTAMPGMPIGGEPLLQPKAVAAFYRARNAAPAWTLPGDAVAIRTALAGLAQDGLDPADYHLARIDSLLEERKRARTDALDTDLEFMLTDAIAAAVDHLRYGRVLPRSLNPEWNVDPRAGAPPLADAIARVVAAGDPAVGIAHEKIGHFIYRGLAGELARLTAAQQAGGWPGVPAGKAIAPGARDRRIPAVRARLRATGELAANAPAPADSLVYDRDLVVAVKLFQDRHRIDAKGALDPVTAAEMSVPVEHRIAQVRANLERARWVLPGLSGDFLLVNLPAYKVYLIRGDRNVWECRTAIGKYATQTPSFRADVKWVIFNPTWTIPKTVLAEDVLAAKGGAAAAIAKKHLRLLDAHGNEVDPKSVDWGSATADNFRYTLRQDAGADNALGRVKFMFPNQYDVYLHDTPSRGVFAAERRAFSHGCIRVADPLGLAQQLLGDQGWDQARIQQAIDAGQTQQVNLTRPLPILIVYWTVSVGASGEVRYAPDVYDMDPPLIAALDRRIALRSEPRAHRSVRG